MRGIGDDEATNIGRNGTIIMKSERRGGGGRAYGIWGKWDEMVAGYRTLNKMDEGLNEGTPRRLVRVARAGRNVVFMM